MYHDTVLENKISLNRLVSLAVLLEDVQVEVNDRKFLRQKVALQWLNQTSDPLTYTPGDTWSVRILTRVVGYSGEGANITLSSEEDTRLCRLANGDLSDDEDVEDTEDAEVFVDTAAEPTEDERHVSRKFRFRDCLG